MGRRLVSLENAVRCWHSWHIALIAVSLLAGCGALTTPGPGGTGRGPIGVGSSAFPSGTFTDCVSGREEQAPDATTGLVPGGALELAGSGTTVTASYTDPKGNTTSLEFGLVASTAATLAHAGQVHGDFTAPCNSQGTVSHYPATLDATSGALTYDAGVVFLTAATSLDADAGACGQRSIPGGFWLACRQGPAGQPVDSSLPASAPTLPSGTYSCITDGYLSYVHPGGSSTGADGQVGALTLSQKGAEVTAQYDDPTLSGFVQLRVTSATTANVETGQHLTTDCPPVINTPPPSTPNLLPIAAGSLSVDGPVLFLSYAGTMDATSSCEGTKKTGSVVCFKRYQSGGKSGTIWNAFTHSDESVDCSKCAAGCVEVTKQLSVCPGSPPIATACSADPQASMADNECACQGRTCSSGQVCYSELAAWDEWWNVNRCGPPPQCHTNQDCSPGQVCIPPLSGVVLTDDPGGECVTPDCRTDADCKGVPNGVCRIVIDQLSANSGAFSFQGVRCVSIP